MEANPILADSKGRYCVDYGTSTGVGCVDAKIICLSIESWGASPKAPADCFLFPSSCQPSGWVDCKSDMETIDGC
jgi:hypothetical protein